MGWYAKVILNSGHLKYFMEAFASAERMSNMYLENAIHIGMDIST